MSLGSSLESVGDEEITPFFVNIFSINHPVNDTDNGFFDHFMFRVHETSCSSLQIRKLAGAVSIDCFDPSSAPRPACLTKRYRTQSWNNFLNFPSSLPYEVRLICTWHSNGLSMIESCVRRCIARFANRSYLRLDKLRRRYR
jgi:hypothetical protein